jgi:putative FmdB family regulatory protein
MPLYEYKCHSCGKTIEVIQKFSDEPLRTHEDCGGELEKLISRSAFQLKGSGWYATDYAKSNGGGNAKSEESKANEKNEKSEKNDKKSDSAKTESGSSESKPAESKSGENKSGESKPAPAASTSETKS